MWYIIYRYNLSLIKIAELKIKQKNYRKLNKQVRN